MTNLKQKGVIGVVCFYHAAVIVLLAIQPSAVLESDMILKQAVDAGEANETKAVQFGFRIFRSYNGEYRSINYSTEQYEVFDKVFYTAKKMAEVSNTLSQISWMMPFAGMFVLAALLFCLKCVKSTNNFFEKNKGFFFLFALGLYPLILILSNILTMLTIPVLSQSNICGPNFMELQHEARLGYGGDGTIALIQNETKASCSITEDTKNFRIIPSIVGTVLLSVELILLWVCMVIARLEQNRPSQVRPSPASRRAPSRNNKPEQHDNTDGESIRSSEATIASSWSAEDLENFEQSTRASETNDADSLTAPTEINDVEETLDMCDLELGTDSPHENTSVIKGNQQPTSISVDEVVQEESADGDAEKESTDGESLSADDLEDFEQSTTASETQDPDSLTAPPETNDFEETLDIGDLELGTDSLHENASIIKGHEQPTSTSVDDEIVHEESGDGDSEKESTHVDRAASIKDEDGLTEQNMVTDEDRLAPDEVSVVSEDLEANTDNMDDEREASDVESGERDECLSHEEEPGAVLESTNAGNVETDNETVSSNEAGSDVESTMAENEIITENVAASDIVV